MITKKLVTRRFIVLAVLAVPSFIALFQIADEKLALAASRSDAVAVIGVDEATGTRFSTIISRQTMRFGRPVPDINNPCPFFRDYIVIGEVPTNVSLSDDEAAKMLVERGKNYAEKACRDFRIRQYGLRVALYLGSFREGKQPDVEAEWKLRIGQKDITMDYRNRALEEGKGRRVDGDFVTFWVDKTTGTQFGVSQGYQWLIQHEPCLFNMHTKSLIGIVPANVNLIDDSAAKAIAKTGFEEFTKLCPKLRQRAAEEKNFRVDVNLYTGTRESRNLQASVAYVLDASGHETLAEYKNHAQYRIKQAEAQIPQQATNPIERTIEGFTLGMSLSDATNILASGIRSGQFTVETIVLPNTSLGSLPVVSDSQIIIDGIKVGNKRSTVFSTRTARAVQLFFYESKLYQIGLVPYASPPLMQKALTEKYGPSPGCQGQPGGIWRDNQTIIDFCGLVGHSAVYSTGKLGENITLRLRYIDKQTFGMVQSYAAQTRRKQEEQTRRKLETLPKGY